MSYFYGPVNYNGGSELRYWSSLVRGFSPLPTNALNLLDVIELTLTRFLGPKTLSTGKDSSVGQGVICHGKILRFYKSIN